MLKQVNGIGLILVPEGRLMAIESLLERTFGKPKVLFWITLCADCCLVHEGARQVFSLKRAVVVVVAVAMVFLFCRGVSVVAANCVVILRLVNLRDDLHIADFHGMVVENLVEF